MARTQTAEAPPAAPLYAYEPLDPDAAENRAKPYNGEIVMVSDDETKPGVAAKWYSTRRRQGYSWKPWTGWIDPVTKQPLRIEPICWRPTY